MEAVMQRPGFAAIPTVVGSFPHTGARLLTERILARFAEMPAWPQMPVRDWRERMYVQYSEGLPGAVVDGQEQRIYFRRGGGSRCAVVDGQEQRIYFRRGGALYAELEP